MAKYRLHANSEVDLLSPEEHKAHLDQTVKDWFQEEARGVTTAPIITIGTPATGTLNLPPNGPDRIGPAVGFAWRVERLTAVGLASGDVLTVSREDTVIDRLTFAQPTIYPGKGLIVRGGERLLIAGTGLTATGSITVNGDATEVGELDLYKLVL